MQANMSDIAIRIENIGKRYDIGSGPFEKNLKETLSDVLHLPFRVLSSLFGDGQPEARRDETIWALKDVSFEVKKGEIVGVIGRNGSGKSTLLKILARVTWPTTGVVSINGRVGSLLEVGTGFHYELSGRDNIFLSGAILGMTKAEIQKKFDQIVSFAEIEKFLDTPVKHYSSGMFVRLAFAVASHLDVEIMLIDEVLAVGDASFQKKCIAKMSEVIRGGRTVMFVSHNISTVAKLCPRALWLESGRISDDGPSERVIRAYMIGDYESTGEVTLPPDPEKAMRLRKVSVSDGSGVSGKLDITEPFRIDVEYDVNQTVTGAHVICFIHTYDGVNVLGSGDADCTPERLGKREPGQYRGTFQIPAHLQLL